MKKLSQILENTLWKDADEKAELIANQKEVSRAFVINFFGMLGLLNRATNKRAVVSYFKRDKQVKIDNIGDDNNNTSLVIKLMDDAGVFKNSQTVTEITRFLAKMKTGTIDTVDDDIVRGWANSLRLNKMKLTGGILGTKFADFRKGKITLSEFSAAVDKVIPKHKKFGGEYKKVLAKAKPTDVDSKIADKLDLSTLAKTLPDDFADDSSDKPAAATSADNATADTSSDAGAATEPEKEPEPDVPPVSAENKRMAIRYLMERYLDQYSANHDDRIRDLHGLVANTDRMPTFMNRAFANHNDYLIKLKNSVVAALDSGTEAGEVSWDEIKSVIMNDIVVFFRFAHAHMYGPHLIEAIGSDHDYFRALVSLKNPFRPGREETEWLPYILNLLDSGDWNPNASLPAMYPRELTIGQLKKIFELELYRSVGLDNAEDYLQYEKLVEKYDAEGTLLKMTTKITGRMPEKSSVMYSNLSDEAKEAYDRIYEKIRGVLPALDTLEALEVAEAHQGHYSAEEDKLILLHNRLGKKYEEGMRMYNTIDGSNLKPDWADAVMKYADIVDKEKATKQMVILLLTYSGTLKSVSEKYLKKYNDAINNEMKLWNVNGSLFNRMLDDWMFNIKHLAATNDFDPSSLCKHFKQVGEWPSTISTGYGNITKWMKVITEKMIGTSVDGEYSKWLITYIQKHMDTLKGTDAFYSGPRRATIASNMELFGADTEEKQEYLNDLYDAALERDPEDGEISVLQTKGIKAVFNALGDPEMEKLLVFGPRQAIGAHVFEVNIRNTMEKTENEEELKKFLTELREKQGQDALDEAHPTIGFVSRVIIDGEESINSMTDTTLIAASHSPNWDSIMRKVPDDMKEKMGLSLTKGLMKWIEDYNEGRLVGPEELARIMSSDYLDDNAEASKLFLEKMSDPNSKVMTEIFSKESVKGIRRRDSKRRVKDAIFGAILDNIEGPNAALADKVYQALDPAFKGGVRNAIGGAGMIKHQLEGDVIKPFEKMTNSRIKQILRFNDMDMDEIIKGSKVRSKKKEPISSYYNRVQDHMEDNEDTGLGFANVEEQPMQQVELDKMSVDLIRKYHAGRHGNVYPKVHKVFNVKLDDSEYQEFLKWHFDNNQVPEKVDPCFHGTGGIAASMILRFGFRVLKQGDGLITGRMLGDGIYFANKIDKSLQYVSNGGYTRGVGTKGYLFVMNSVLGKKGQDYQAAGLGGDSIRSAEWCVVDARKQLKILTAYEVEIINGRMVKDMKASLNEDINGKRLGDIVSESNEEIESFTFHDGLFPVYSHGADGQPEVEYYSYLDDWKDKVPYGVEVEPGFNGMVTVSFRNALTTAFHHLAYSDEMSVASREYQRMFMSRVPEPVYPADDEEDAKMPAEPERTEVPY